MAFNFDFNLSLQAYLNQRYILAYKHNIVTDALLRMRKREASTRKIAMHRNKHIVHLSLYLLVSFRLDYRHILH